MHDTSVKKNEFFKLAPSILTADFACLGQEVSKIEDTAHYLHIDVMDGYLVPHISMGIPIIKSMRKRSNLFFDVHLMTRNPLNHIESFAKAGADGITFHFESYGNKEDRRDTIKLIKEHKKRVGIAIQPDTEVNEVLPFINMVDMVLIMSVEPGFGGQKFIYENLAKAKKIKDYIKSYEINIDIQMDGGINIENIRDVLTSGVNIPVVGSAIFNAKDAKAEALKYIEVMGEFI